MVVPSIHVLIKTFESLSKNCSSRFVAELHSSIDRRLSCYEECSAFWIAAALNAHFKLKWCTSAESDKFKSILIEKVTEANAKQTEVVDSTTTRTQKKKESLSFFDTLKINFFQ